MATEVFVGGSEARAKIRNPWGVLGLSVVTLGIYTIFWWYYVNRELVDLGKAKRVSGLGDNPWISTAAYIAGGFLFYVPTIWTIVTTTRRIQSAHRVTQQKEVLNGWLAAVVWIFTLGFGGPVFTQYQMNRLWTDQSAAQPIPSDASAGNGSGTISEQELEAEKAQVLPGDTDQKGTP